MNKLLLALLLALSMFVSVVNVTYAEEGTECVCGVDPETGACIPCPEEPHE